MSSVNAALEVAKKYPVFPTHGKKPAWSNAELGVKRGQGGYKVATQDPEEVERLFSHPRATEIAVPMGAMSGLICVDVDLHKGGVALASWMDNETRLLGTRVHKTRSGGRHFIFQHPGDEVTHYPATLREGVDLKASGNGYVCFPPTQGYTVLHNIDPAPFPTGLLVDALKAKGGTGSLTGGAYNSATDAELIKRITEATDIYPSLRTLSMRLPTKRPPGGTPRTALEMRVILEHIMLKSVAANPHHPRHEDWQDRWSKIRHLVETAIVKSQLEHTEEEWQQISEAQGGERITRPIGPQPDPTPEAIEALVGEVNKEDKQKEFKVVNAQSLRSRVIPPMAYIVPHMLARGNISSVAGTSNVGKTRWVAALVTALAKGDTERMGLPQMLGAPATTLWIANEERVEDCERRIKAAMYQHNDHESADIIIRGKDEGMMQLVGINELGHPEIDQKAVARVVAEVRRHDVALVALDPYSTLSAAIDENSSSSAGIMTKAMLLVATLGNCAVLYMHHTPKGGKGEDDDWYRGKHGAWRGSGNILAGLDMGFTLSPWIPAAGERRKHWKKSTLDRPELRRWIVLDGAKIREGELPKPTVWQLQGQRMGYGEGMDIGVCRLASAKEADDALENVAVDLIRASALATSIVQTMGAGEYTSMGDLNEAMTNFTDWPDVSHARGKQQLYEMFHSTVLAEGGGSVRLVCDDTKRTTGRWTLVVKEDV